MQVTDYMQPLAFHYEKACEVPAQCLKAAARLRSQPLFDGNGSLANRCKVIPLKTFDDVRIFEIFNNNAAQITAETVKWHIHSFGNGNYQFSDAKGRRIDQGLELWDVDKAESYSLETLKTAYDEVYRKMRQGFVKSDPKNYPDILIKMDSGKFTFFIKNEPLSEEDTLIRFLASKFELDKEVRCYSYWKAKDAECPDHDKIYMWVNTEKLPQIIETFGFEE